MFSLIRKRLIDILGIGNILDIDHSVIQNVRLYKTCRNVKLNKFFLLCIWPNSSIEKGLFLKCHNVIDLVNSSPNMDRFCHCGRNLEFCREIWICTNCQNWYFTLFIIILRFVWKWFRNGQFRDLTLCESGSPTMVWRRASRTKALHWARVSRYTQAAATVNADTARRYTFATYIRDTTTRYKTKIYPLNILPKPRAQLPVWLFASCIWQFIVSLGNAAATSSTTSLTILNDFMSVYGFQFFYFIFPIFQFCISSISVPQCESPTITLEPTFSCFPVSPVSDPSSPVSSPAPQQVCQRASLPFPGKDWDKKVAECGNYRAIILESRNNCAIILQ